MVQYEHEVMAVMSWMTMCVFIRWYGIYLTWGVQIVHSDQPP